MLNLQNFKQEVKRKILKVLTRKKISLYNCFTDKIILSIK